MINLAAVYSQRLETSGFCCFLSIYPKSFHELLIFIKNVLYFRWHFASIKFCENKMFIISGVFSFTIWQKIAKLAKFNTRYV